MKKTFIQVGSFIILMWGVFIVSSIIPLVKSFAIITRTSIQLKIVGMTGLFQDQ